MRQRGSPAKSVTLDFLKDLIVFCLPFIRRERSATSGMIDPHVPPRPIVGRPWTFSTFGFDGASASNVEKLLWRCLGPTFLPRF